MGFYCLKNCITVYENAVNLSIFEIIYEFFYFCQIFFGYIVFEGYINFCVMLVSGFYKFLNIIKIFVKKFVMINIEVSALYHRAEILNIFGRFNRCYQGNFFHFFIISLFSLNLYTLLIL